VLEGTVLAELAAGHTSEEAQGTDQGEDQAEILDISDLSQILGIEEGAEAARTKEGLQGTFRQSIKEAPLQVAATQVMLRDAWAAPASTVAAWRIGRNQREEEEEDVAADVPELQ